MEIKTTFCFLIDSQVSIKEHKYIINIARFPLLDFQLKHTQYSRIPKRNNITLLHNDTTFL